jgi:putative cell wall-binding protein/methionine-rich copper-binding protein CopC
VKKRLSILLTAVLLFTAVFGASLSAVYASGFEGRIAGQNRYETACTVAKTKFQSAEAVIIVRGDSAEDGTPNVVDGLTASVLAGAKNAPILLTDDNALPDVVKNTIQALGAEKTYIVGGEGAVSANVEAELKDLGLTVERIAGQNRFETAVEVAKAANTGSKTAIVTQYLALVDSLVAGPLAFVNKYPIFLVGKDAVGDVTKQAIKDLGIENIIIVGGTGVISDSVKDELDGLVSGSVIRLGGNDRYLTSVAVAQKFESVKEVALVNGESFVDAVAASVLGMPILYVKKDSMISEVEGFIASKASDVKVIGGTGVISDTLANKAADSIKFVVTSVSANNLKEIVVSFSQALNKDTVIKANFKLNNAALGDNDSVALNPDGKSVTITLANALTNATSYKVTVSGVKSASGISIAETTVDFLAFDTTFPTALKAEQIGPSTIKVTFSEPIKSYDYSNFKVNDGEYFIDGSSVTPADGGKAVTFNLYTTLEQGKAYTVTVSGVKDYADLTMMKPVTLSFVGIKDSEKPKVTGVVSATPEQVVLQFNENITLLTNDWSKFYHTNSSNKADNVVVENGNQLKISFATHNLPSGIAYLYIAKEVVQDGWGNKNDAINAYALAVTVDNIKPSIKEVKAVSDKKIEITFTEDIEDGATGTYTILDSTGAKVTSPTFSVNQSATNKVELLFTSALPGSTYTVVVEKVKDLAGNEIDKTSRTVTVVDTTAPTVNTTAYLYPAKKIVKVMFNEPIKASDLLNLGNYIYNDKYLTQYNGVTATVTDGGKASAEE